MNTPARYKCPEKYWERMAIRSGMLSHTLHNAVAVPHNNPMILMDDQAREALHSLEHAIVSRGYDQKNHHTPTRHSPDEAFVLMPHKRGMPLRSLEKSIDAVGARSTVVILPLFLQLDPMVFWTHRAHHIPHAAAAPNQPQVIVEMIRQLKPQLVIATPETARRSETALADANLKTSFAWHLICHPNHLDSLPLERDRYTDAHFIPGCSGAYQCAHLAHEESQHFHLSDAYRWSEINGTLCATSIDDTDPAQLQAFPVCNGHLEAHACPCGATTSFVYNHTV